VSLAAGRAQPPASLALTAPDVPQVDSAPVEHNLIRDWERTCLV